MGKDCAHTWLLYWHREYLVRPPTSKFYKDMHSHSEICTEALCRGRGDTCKARGDEGAGTGEEMLVTQILTGLGIMKT